MPASLTDSPPTTPPLSPLPARTPGGFTVSEHQDRPATIPHDSDLARRAEAPRCGVDRVISAVAYHAGPEIAFTTVVGGAGALLVHPAALPVVAALVAVYAAADRITRRRRVEGSAARTASATPTSKDWATTDETSDDARDEGIARS